MHKELAEMVETLESVQTVLVRRNTEADTDRVMMSFQHVTQAWLNHKRGLPGGITDKTYMRYIDMIAAGDWWEPLRRLSYVGYEPTVLTTRLEASRAS